MQALGRHRIVEKEPLTYPTKRITGRINVVQEGRFRLSTDSGRGLLLTLSRNANVTSEDLCRYHEHGARVQVEYEGEPNFASGVALKVEV